MKDLDYIYKYLENLTKMVKDLENRPNPNNDEISNIKTMIKDMEREIEFVKRQPVTVAEMSRDLLKKMNNYTIKDGYWYFGNEKLIPATGPQGPKGYDGLDGKDGIDGLDGEIGPVGPRGPKGPKGDTGPMGPKGEDGRDGIDGKSTNVEVGTVQTIGALEDAKVIGEKNGNTLRLHFKIPRGARGQNGSNATINGNGTVEIVEGTNIDLIQDGTTLTISSTLPEIVSMTQAEYDAITPDANKIYFVG